MIVVDAVVTIHLVVAGDETEAVEDVLRRDSDWVVPPNWRSECLNALNKYRRRGDFGSAGVLLRFERARKRVRFESYRPASDVLDLSVSSGCSVYDCEYATLARHLGVPFVTFDKPVIRAGLGVHPKDFLEG